MSISHGPVTSPHTLAIYRVTARNKTSMKKGKTMITQIRRLALGGFASLSCTLSLLLGGGCDVASSNEALTISPASAVLSRGQTVTFTVSGGYAYKWSLDPDDGSGSLDTRSGSQVTYTCLATNIGTSPKLVRVASTIDGTSGTSTNSSTTNSAYEVHAYADIYYASTGSSTTSSLVVSPSSATVLTKMGPRVSLCPAGHHPTRGVFSIPPSERFPPPRVPAQPTCGQGQDPIC